MEKLLKEVLVLLLASKTEHLLALLVEVAVLKVVEQLVLGVWVLVEIIAIMAAKIKLKADVIVAPWVALEHVALNVEKTAGEIVQDLALKAALLTPALLVVALELARVAVVESVQETVIQSVLVAIIIVKEAVKTTALNHAPFSVLQLQP